MIDQSEIDSGGPTPDWSKWHRFAAGTLPQLVALSCNLDPENSAVKWFTERHLERDLHLPFWDAGRDVYAKQIPPDQLKAFLDRLDVAASHVQAGELETSRHSVRGEVRVDEFARWAASTDLGLPPEFPKNPSAPARGAPGEWPWGTYETSLLRELANAAEHFWKSYDPTSPASAPANEDVTAWLIQRGVKKKLAQAMAQILRAEGLPAGSR